MNARRPARVSLSDWLALWARIRGFETPRLLRDRPTDGAARAAKIYAGGKGMQIAAGMIGPAEIFNGARSCGAVFQTVSPFRQETEGLKTPGY